jgi:hypothetical protein
MEETPSEIVPVTLENGMVIHIEARDLGGTRKVGAFDNKAFSELTGSIEAIAVAFRDSLAKIQPRKASVEFGIEVGIEAGQLTALICKGSGKANLKVSLEWSETEPK